MASIPKAQSGPAYTESQAKRFRTMGFTVSFPYNHDPDFYARVAPHLPLFTDVYAGLHPEIFPNSRPYNGGPDPDAELDRLADLHEKLADHGVMLNVVVNTLFAENVREERFFDAIRRLQAIAPIRITVADLYWAVKLHDAFPEISLEASTIAGIATQYQAKLWRDLAGVDTVVLGRDVNKRLDAIKKIRIDDTRIKMVAIDSCLPFCPAGLRHQVVHSIQSDSFVSARQHGQQSWLCRHMKREIPSYHAIKKEVLPFHLPHYEGLVDIIKLIDRYATTDFNLAMLARYVAMEDDTHPVVGYRESEETIKKLSGCGFVCHDCSWCADKITLVSERDDIAPDAAVGGVDSGGSEEAAKADGSGRVGSSLQVDGDGSSLASSFGALLKEKQQTSTRRLSLFATVVRCFSPLIVRSESLSNGFKLSGFFEDEGSAGIGLEFRRGKDRMRMVAVSPDYVGQTVMRSEALGLFLLFGEDGGDTDRFFREAQDEFEWLLNNTAGRQK